MTGRTEYKGFPAFPHLQHILDPMFVPTDDAGNVLDTHHCHLCKPEFYATLAPGCTTCCRCGVIILTGKEDDPFNEALDMCEGCAVEVEEKN